MRMILRNSIIRLLIIFIIHINGSVLLAQSSGKITGIVRDASTGEVLLGANVLIEGTTLGSSTDLKGRYFIFHIPPGKYKIRAEYIGYKKVSVQNVEVLTDLTTTVNFDLHQEGILGEEITIFAEKPLVRKDLTSTESRVQADEIDRMPVIDLRDILRLQAGIISESGGDLHIRGGRSSEISYLVNGISITDDFYRNQAFQVEKESIQELQVISGTFNAEYGNAMSGVINIITKTGGNSVNGKIEAWVGDYFSNRTDIFWNIDALNPLSNYNIQGMFSGPIIKDRLSYFFTARRWNDEGWLYGPNTYLPQGRRKIDENNITTNFGDSSAIAMNARERWSGQGSLNWRILDPVIMKMDFLGSSFKDNEYNHIYRLDPLGLRGAKGSGATLITKITHILNKTIFHESTLSYKWNTYQSDLYDDPFDERYVHPDSLIAGKFQFYKAGTDLSHMERATKSFIIKWDLTGQLTDRHQVKTGFELQKDIIDFENYQIVPATDITGQQIEPFQPSILPLSTPKHNLIKRQPVKYAVFMQDKIEYQSVIINVGLRFDYFNANGVIPVDLQDPNVYNPSKLIHIYKDLNGDDVIDLLEQTEDNQYSLDERKSFWYKNTTPKTQFSPRLGIAYPITDKGVIHFSYGIFQQVPEYSQLYEGDELKLTEAQGIGGPFGNPDLNPQRTIMYELGLKQQLTENIGIDITGYYRDIRDWISTSAPIPTYSTGITYSKKINKDFANVKGLTFCFIKRFDHAFSVNLDYTLQEVQGINSSPLDEYYAINAGAEPKKKLTPLNWDQTHALNVNVNIGTGGWGMNLIARYNSGHPYSPSIVAGSLTGQNILSDLAINSRRMPDRFTMDINVFKALRIRGLNVRLFAQVFNLLDKKNANTVWTDTGKPDYTIYQRQSQEADPTWFIRPDFYDPPRSIQVGIQIKFEHKY